MVNSYDMKRLSLILIISLLFILSCEDKKKEPEIFLEPQYSQVDFGILKRGQSIKKSIVISNTGNADLTIQGLIIPDGFDTDWTTATIPSDENKVLIIYFKPTENKDYENDLKIVNNDEEKIVHLTGIGAIPEITLNKSSFNFGEVITGDNTTETLKIMNGSEVDLIVSQIQLPNGFTSNWQGGTVKSKQSQSVTLTFSPTVEQDYDNDLKIFNDANDITLPLQGEGIPYNFQINYSATWNYFPQITSVSPDTVWKTSVGITEKTYSTIIEIKFEITNEQSITYSWEFGDGTTSTEKTPIHKFPTFGQYTVKLIGKYNSYNSDTLSINWNLEPLGNSKIEWSLDNEETIAGNPNYSNTGNLDITLYNYSEKYNLVYNSFYKVSIKLNFTDFTTTTSVVYVGDASLSLPYNEKYTIKDQHITGFYNKWNKFDYGILIPYEFYYEKVSSGRISDNSPLVDSNTKFNIESHLIRILNK